MVRSFRQINKRPKNSYIDAELAVTLLSGRANLQLLSIDGLHLRMTRQVHVAVRAARPRSGPLLPVIVMVRE